MLETDNTLTFSNQIERMFNSIAPRYDFLNSILSLGQDKYWRKKAIDKLAPVINERILDIATGTGDMLLEIASRNNRIKIAGLDFSRQMLKYGKNKVLKKGFNQSISFYIGNGECMPFADKSFDGAVCGFGVRNFSNISNGLVEFHRILKPSGRMVILEFSFPSNKVFGFIYKLYFNIVLPIIGKIFSGHKYAYSYLPLSVKNFPSHIKFTQLLEDAGFTRVSFHKLSLGIVSIHCGIKL